jgi:DNA processing protein
MIDLLALSLLPVSRWRYVAERLRSGSPPADVLEDLCLERTARDPSKPTAIILRSRASVAMQMAARTGLIGIPFDDPLYPTALAAIIDPPPVLWSRGQPHGFDRPAVALVGSRAGSPYALAVAERLAADLAGHGVAIVSGLARGVDSASHRGALSVGGTTLAVLGCGVDKVYPAEHGSLAREIAASGAVLSELMPGTPPRPQYFPQRNRIISGLSRAVVVIEAGEKSGSLITARCALEQGRDVLAVPGNALNGRNRGGHALLRDGARLVETAEDVLDELGVSGTSSRSGGAVAGHDLVDHGEADPVLQALAVGEASDLDAIADRSGLRAARLLPRLLDLELQGLVRRVGGGRFVRV